MPDVTPEHNDADTHALRPARWWVLADGASIGPFALVEVRQRVLAGMTGPATYVWADGMPDWMHARLVPALVPPASVRAGLPAWQ
ncbi:MAG: DUF4339 domain-containing protein [Nitriliruptoraceae bacterium]